MAVACSGGGDSTALLAIAADWARLRGAPDALVVLHVDHRLRAGSDVEAAQVCALAERLGVRARVLRWEAAKPASGVQAAARRARHALLARTCAEEGAGLVLLAHTEDDQAETVLMRLARAPATARALAGLAPLAPSPAWPAGVELAIARPLLDVSRAALRTRLAAAGLTWAEDPSNRDDAHERIRARARLERLGPQGRARLARVAERASAAESVRRRAAVRALGAVDALDFGAFALDRARFDRAPRAARLLAVEALVTAAAGRPGPLEPAAVERLLEALAPGAVFRAATLGGAALAEDRGGVVVIARDPGAVGGRRATLRDDRGGAPSVNGAAVVDGVWDGRFRLDQHSDQKQEIAVAGGRAAQLPSADRARLRAAPALARRTAPVIEGPDGRWRLALGSFMGSQALARRLLPDQPWAWCDDAAARAALGFWPHAPHIAKRSVNNHSPPVGSERTGKTLG